MDVNGIKNPNFKHGETLKQHYCKICGKKISYTTWKYGLGMCSSCSHKGERSIRYNPEKHKKHYCIEPGCNNEISYNNWRYGQGRCADCYHKMMKLENHPNWKNGSSFEEYGAGFDNALKEQVRFRDNYKCQICGCSQLENGRQLDVHHKDYNKKNNLPENLIALCHKCHMKTNGNREYWIEFFKNNKTIKVRRK